MCAILGCDIEQPTAGQFITLRRIFQESQIRGKHATGATLLWEGELVTTRVAEPGENFVNSPETEEFWEKVSQCDHLTLIGHCRYSTSDINYNQPIHPEGTGLSIVHNGVVDQRPPEHWFEYGYKLLTNNDSELIWHCVNQGNEPLLEFPEASMAVGELHQDGTMRFYRNGKRPLWISRQENGYFVTSTRDIAMRAGLTDLEPMQPGVIVRNGAFAPLKQIEELIPYDQPKNRNLRSRIRVWRHSS